MPSKNVPTRKPLKSRTQRKQPHKVNTKQIGKLKTEALEGINERLDMMLPEVMSRIAAVEHVLVEKNICSPTDLRSSRQFIDKQESW